VWQVAVPGGLEFPVNDPRLGSATPKHLVGLWIETVGQVGRSMGEVTASAGVGKPEEGDPISRCQLDRPPASGGVEEALFTGN